jgi:hypothetical protein
MLKARWEDSSGRSLQVVLRLSTWFPAVMVGATSHAGCKEIAMSSSFLVPSPQLSGVGSGNDGPERSLDEVAFARRVRSPWWQWSMPLLVSALFGAALVSTAVAAPPTRTVRQMLASDQERTVAAEVEALAVGADYSLPAHWQTVPLGVADGPLACDPASSAFTC